MAAEATRAIPTPDSAAPLWQVDLQIGALPPMTLASHASRLVVMGPSGVGKTTLLRSIAGVEERARGIIRFGGETWLDSSARARVPAWERRVGWSPQEALLFPHLDVRQNLLASPHARAGELDAIAAGLELAHLLRRRPRHLSGGERHRVALGRALLADSKVLLLDEPFAALDRALRTRVVAFVARELERKPRALLLISHDEATAGPLAGELWELEATGLVRRDSA